MNLIKLVIILFEFCCINTQIVAKVEEKSTRNVDPSAVRTAEKSPFKQLEEFLTESVNNFKLEFHRSFEESRIKRKQKDNFLYSLPDRGVLIEEQLKVEKATNLVFPSLVGTDPIRMWTVIESSHKTYLFWGHSSGMLVLAEFTVRLRGAHINPLATYVEKENGIPFKSHYFLYDSHIWLVVAFKRGLESEYIVVYQYIPHIQTFMRKQTIKTNGLRINFDVTSKGMPYMALISYTDRTPNGQSFQSTLKLYEWHRTQFDLMAEQKTFSATSVKLFDMGGTLYIAVTQEYNRSMSLVIDYSQVRGSPVFLYNSHEKKLTYAHIIPIFAAKVDHFRVDGCDYLVFADPNDISRIYWWAGHQFVSYQDLIETKGAISVSAVRLPNAEILLAFLHPNRVQFFTESISSKYLLNTYLQIPEPAFTDFKLFSWSQTHYFSVFTFHHHLKTPLSSIWKLSLIRHEIQDSYDYDPLRSCLLKLEQTLAKREDELRDMTARADRVWLANTSKNITAPVIVRGRVKAKAITANQVFITNNNKKVPQITNTYVKTRTDSLSNGLKAVLKDSNNLVLRSTDQIIAGRTVFTEPINAGHSSVKNIANRDMYLNKIRFQSLADNSLHINGNQVINAHFSFNTITADILDNRGLINHLNISDALLADWPHMQVVSGDHKYGDIIMHNNLLLNNKFGSINGIFDEQFVTKFGANQQISGQKVFTLLEAKNIDLSGTLNGRDLSAIANRAVLLNGPNQVITGQLIMDLPITVNNVKLLGLINGLVNVTEMALNAVTISGDQKITGHKTFKGLVTVSGDVEVSGTVNNMKLSRDVITTNTKQVITGNIEFKSFVEFMHDIDSQFVNGIDLSGDCVLRNDSQPQYITQKVFNKTVVVLGNITMDSGSTIDGTDPSELLKLVISHRNTAFSGPVTFNKLTVIGNIFAKSINERLISDLPNIVWLKTVNQTIRVPVVFDGLIKARQLSSPNVNGFVVPNDFVHKTEGPNEVIVSEKRFVDNVVINGNVDISRGKGVNAIDLHRFERLVVKKQNNLDSIRGLKHFRAVGVLGNVMTSTVNGLNVSEDMLLTNRRQTINGNIRLMGPKTHINGKLQVMSDINVKTTVNNHSLSQFANDVLLTNRWPHWHQRPCINKVFAAGIGAQHITADGLINGIDINDMKSRVVTLNTEQQVLAKKNFSSTTRFRADVFAHRLNGLKIRDFASKVILKHRKTLVRGYKKFFGDVVIRSNVEISGTINKMDVRSLQRRIMSRSRSNVVLAPMTFANDINLGHLRVEAPATIDGLKPHELALIGYNLVFNGNIVFNRNTSAKTHIYVNGLVNGCDLKRLGINAVMYGNTTHLQIIRGMNQFSNLEVLGNVNIAGPLNGLNINSFASRVVTKSGNQVLRGPLVFENDVIVDKLFVRNLINGKNISHVLRDAVLKSKAQIIRSRKIFLNPLLANGSRTEMNGYVNVEGLVNGINVVKLNQTSVRQHSSQTISGMKTFAGRVTYRSDVFIGGTLTGIKVPNDLVLVNTNELISGSTHFENWVSCKQDLNVNKLIDGIDLSYFVANRLSLNDSQLIVSILNFTNGVTVDRLLVKKTINNIPIDAFVTRKGSHDINGIKTFARDLIVNGNLQSPGSYNGINIHNLVNRAVSLVRPEVITGITEFTTPVSMHQMIITGLLNGYDISNLAKFFGKNTAQVNQLLAAIKHQLNRQENALTTQFASNLKDSSTGIIYFILSQDIYETGERFLIDSYRPSVFNVRPIDSLILWTYKPENGGQCRLYSSITYTISEKGFIRSESNREFGRNIPLNSEKLFGKQDLSLWTNTTNCDSRLNEKSLMEVIHTDPLSSIPFRRFVPNDKYPEYRDIIAPVLRDAKLFVSNNSVYVLLAQNYDKKLKSFHTNSTIMALDSRTGRWSPIQQIETFGVHSVDLISYGRDRRVFAALANRANVPPNAVHSVIHEWNALTQKFVINTVVLTSHPSAVIFVETPNEELFCVFANEKTKLFENNCNEYDNSLYTQPINIYRYNGKTFHYFQSIDINGVISLDTFTVSNQTYIAAASRLLGTTFILQLRGYNKFEVIQELPTSGVQNVKSFWSSDGNLHLAVASEKSGHTKILTAVINGSHNVKKYSSMEELLFDSQFIKYYY